MDIKRERSKLAVRKREQDAKDMHTVGGMFDRMHCGGRATTLATTTATSDGTCGEEEYHAALQIPPGTMTPGSSQALGDEYTAGGAAGADAARIADSSRRKKVAAGGLYDAADVALPGYSFPMSGRRAAAPTVVEDLARELALVDEEEEDAARLARQAWYNSMLRAGTLRIADPDFY